MATDFTSLLTQARNMCQKIRCMTKGQKSERNETKNVQKKKINTRIYHRDDDLLWFVSYYWDLSKGRIDR